MRGRTPARKPPPLRIARSELDPTLSAVALSGVDRDEAGSSSRFYRQTKPDYQVELDLNYTIFDLGARRGRIDAACAQLLAANFGFNDLPPQTYLRSFSRPIIGWLNASAQESAARASLEQCTGWFNRLLKSGWKEWTGHTAGRAGGAQCDCPSTSMIFVGTFGSRAERLRRAIWLPGGLGASAYSHIRVQPFSAIAAPETLGDTTEQVIDRAIAQRPDLQAEVAGVREANAQQKEALARRFIQALASRLLR